MNKVKAEKQAEKIEKLVQQTVQNMNTEELLAWMELQNKGKQEFIKRHASMIRSKEEMKHKMGLKYSDKTSCFELKLFSKASRKFPVDFTNIFKVSERST